MSFVLLTKEEYIQFSAVGSLNYVSVSAILEGPNHNLIGGFDNIFEQLPVSRQAFNMRDTFAQTAYEKQCFTKQIMESRDVDVQLTQKTGIWWKIWSDRPYNLLACLICICCMVRPTLLAVTGGVKRTIMPLSKKCWSTLKFA
jgi:hypothetical protein